MLEMSKSPIVALMLLVGLAVAPALAVTQDGFGDGDRNNDGILDDPDGSGTGVVDDPLDVGWAFWRVFRTATENQVVRVAHDPGGLGDDNALIVDATGDQAYQVANLDPAETLANAKEYIKLSFQVRFVGEIPSMRDTFRFGLFNSNGTVVNEDQTAGNSTVADDPGYIVTFATGANPDPSRARLAENGPGASAGSLFALDRTLVLQEPAQHIINDNLPHHMAIMVVRTYGSGALVRAYLDGAKIMEAHDPVGVLHTFNEIGFGCVGAVLDYNLDDIVIERGVVEDCEAILGVNVTAPLPAGGTTVMVTDVSPEAEEVRVYAGETLIGTFTGWPPLTPATVAVTVSPLVAGQVITARQVIAGTETCAFQGNSVIVNNCEDVGAVMPAIGLQPGDTQVPVLGVSPIAQEVRVYEDGTILLGSAPGNGTETVTVTVNAPLRNGQTIMATQVINGVESCMPIGLVVRGSLVTVLEDGFGDGDRNNDGTPEGPVDDPADTGVAWWRVTDVDHTLSIAHDPDGLGDDNALFSTCGRSRLFVIARFEPVTLVDPGDFIRLSFDWRATELIDMRDTFRFGLYDENGTAVTTDQTGYTNVLDDIGYFATMPTGAPPAGDRDARLVHATTSGNANNGALFSLDETLLDEENPSPVTNDLLPHKITMTIAKLADNRVRVTVTYDGNLYLEAEDTSDTTHGPVATLFNQVAFGSVGNTSPFFDYAIDNVKIEAKISGCNDPVFDVDGDGQVGLADAGQFQLCATGPRPDASVFAALSESCQCLDVNDDQAIDMLDFAVFQGASPRAAARGSIPPVTIDEARPDLSDPRPHPPPLAGGAAAGGLSTFVCRAINTTLQEENYWR